MVNSLLSTLVADLPEIYQPIYGHPELSEQVSRTCEDRLTEIVQAHDTLRALLGRPVKVLDLGCAQGFFSLSLAASGAVVRGVDFLDKNIAVCNALAAECPQLLASFETGRIEDTIARLEPDQYDLVLGLSVFHHVVHEQGVEPVRCLLQRAAERCAVLVLELALREEPLYWGPSQPQDPRLLLQAIAFVHERARHGTHLAPVSRPLFVASNRYWILADRGGPFESWTDEPHPLAKGTHQGSRRYFSSATHCVKQLQFDHSRGQINRKEFAQEAAFLANPPDGFPAATCVLSLQAASEGWLVTERLPGRLLLDLLREGAAVDHRQVLLQVLRQLAALELVGLYHDDVRAWNVLLADDGTVHLIDYGSISPMAQDCVWPTNPFLAFLIFVKEVATGLVDDPLPLRSIGVSPFGLSQPYQAWAALIWQRPVDEWSFGLMHETLLQLPAELPEQPKLQPDEVWMKAMEEACQALKLHINEVHRQANMHAEHASDRIANAEVLARQASDRAAKAEVLARQASDRAAKAEAHAEQSSERAAKAEAHVEQSSERAAKAEAHAGKASERAASAASALTVVHDSLSWKLTAPLRLLGRLANKAIQTLQKWLR